MTKYVDEISVKTFWESCPLYSQCF